MTEHRIGATRATDLGLSKDDVERRRLIESFFEGGQLALDAGAEYNRRHDEFVMEMPQSGERIRGRDQMRAMQEAFPAPPQGVLRRTVGTGDFWVVEGTNDYGSGDLWDFVVIMEFRDGRILRETRYYGKKFEPPAWRSQWVEPIES
jgi:hypothetical protein